MGKYLENQVDLMIQLVDDDARYISSDFLLDLESVQAFTKCQWAAPAILRLIKIKFITIKANHVSINYRQPITAQCQLSDHS